MRASRRSSGRGSAAVMQWRPSTTERGEPGRLRRAAGQWEAPISSTSPGDRRRRRDPAGPPAVPGHAGFQRGARPRHHTPGRGPPCRTAPPAAGASGARRRTRHGLFAATLEERSPSVAVRAMAAALSTSDTRRAGGPGCPRPRGCKRCLTPVRPPAYRVGVSKILSTRESR